MKFEKIFVTAYSGYKCNERPVSFLFRGKEHTVDEIIDRWYQATARPNEPKMEYYKVKTADGETCILRYNGLFDVWSILLAK